MLFLRRSTSRRQSRPVTMPSRDTATYEMARSLARPAAATGAQAIGAIALGAVALGALAIGALAIGRLAIGRARIRRLEIDELVVRRLQVTEQLEIPLKSGPESWSYAACAVVA